VRAVRVGLFGRFGSGNFGNDSTLQAILFHVRRLAPAAEVTCICTAPEAVASEYGIGAQPIRRSAAHRSPSGRRPSKAVGKALSSAYRELCRWADCIRIVRKFDALIVPGTGLLTDASSLFEAGPYDLFRWCLAAKVSHRRICFVSVGAGPFFTRRGKWMVRWSLAMADFRSYRDESTLQILRKIGFSSARDRVSPDLAFSLPDALLPNTRASVVRPSIVAVGVIQDTGRYSSGGTHRGMYLKYLESLAAFVQWLVVNGKRVRLVTGDLGDREAVETFCQILQARFGLEANTCVVDEPLLSARDVVSQLAITDLAIATRFHNLVLALLLNKPTISISFHPKCASLMNQMGLGEYCRDINDVTAQWLIDQFCRMEERMAELKDVIATRAKVFRDELDIQYRDIFVGLITA